MRGCKKVSAIFTVGENSHYRTRLHKNGKERTRTHLAHGYSVCVGHGHELAPHTPVGIAIGLRTSQCVWNRNLEPRRYRTNCVTAANSLWKGNLEPPSHSSRGTRTCRVRCWNPERRGVPPPPRGPTVERGQGSGGWVRGGPWARCGRGGEGDIVGDTHAALIGVINSGHYIKCADLVGRCETADVSHDA